MKLNAASEMMPLSWSHWGKMHPFAPANQTEGYKYIIDELGKYLCEITAFDACSLQPNSGAQGEYAGLLTIKAYHEANGDLGAWYQSGQCGNGRDESCGGKSIGEWVY